MKTEDDRQNQFSDYVVPDPGRILKVKKWLLGKKIIRTDSVSNILEIGYSIGGLLDQLSGYSELKKYAMDINQKDTPGDIEFYKCDCNRGFPDFDGVTFDVVFAGEVIEHIFDDEQFLKNIHMHLKPGGVLVLTTPNLFFLPNRILFPFGIKPFFAWQKFHYHTYDIRTLSDMVRQSGYEIKKIKSSHILISSRKFRRIGRFFEMLGDWFPSIGGHIILFAEKEQTPGREEPVRRY